MFIDANILNYQSLRQSQFHMRANAAIERAQDAGKILSARRQVLREYLAASTRLYQSVALLTLTQATADIMRLADDLRILEDGPEVWQSFKNLLQDGGFSGKQVHDAYLVATMLAHGESELLTNNAADFTRFGNRIAIIDI
jgi:predicted nucleic acid-binding protein